MNPYNHNFGQTLTTDADGVVADRAFLAHVTITDALAIDSDVILDGVEAPSGEDAEALVVDEFLAQPDVARNATVTIAATTVADIAAGNIVVAGTDIGGNVISEDFAITADTAGSVTGNLAFVRITSVTIPVQDGASVTVDVGVGKKFGIPYNLPYAGAVITKLFDGAADTGTITASASALAANVISLNGTPNGAKDIDLYVMV